LLFRRFIITKSTQEQVTIADVEDLSSLN